MLSGAGNVQRGPKMAIVCFQIGPDVNKKPHAFGTPLKKKCRRRKTSNEHAHLNSQAWRGRWATCLREGNQDYIPG